MEKIHEIRAAVHSSRPLIHCITNPISIAQCANAVLAVGARPIMAEHPLEVREITASAQAIVLNLGNITDVRMESMRISLTTALENKIPTAVDAVGTACSSLRCDFLTDLLKTGSPAIIKGNYSEIAALYQTDYRSSGVDADGSLDTKTVSRIAGALAEKYRCTILASGKTDIVTDGKRLVHLHNGTAQLSSVTGTGCMLGALCGTYLSETDGLDAAVCACTVLGICGQLAQTDRGNGSFMVNLLDALSTLTSEQTETMIRMEERNFEEI
ncbi:MAG: hydroxyethylthiazole kinase [Clostridia bacterium]|nr:hydroxyethylthiazole kinase [Clostridia bacterium]